MYLTIHRGSAQIGGTLLEIGTSHTRLLFDAGTNLPPLDGSHVEDDFELEGLTYGSPAFDGVFLSHHHNDHCGLLPKLLPDTPVFAGEETERVLHILADFTHQPQPEIQFRIHDGRTIQINDLWVTPLAVPHSARGAYMFLVQANDCNVLYTGDFRTADGVVQRVRERIGPEGKLDALVCEGTNIRRTPQEREAGRRGEDWVMQRAQEEMLRCPGTVFVLCSSTNADRIDAISQAAEQAGRLLCEDLFQAAVYPKEARTTVPERQLFVASYVDQAKSPRIWPYFRRLHRARALVGAESLSKRPEPKVVFVRTSMFSFLKRYLDARPEEECLLLYSMWQGYRQSDATQKFLDFFARRNIPVVDLHCSGHAYWETLEAFVAELTPAALVPIHCQAGDREEFLSLSKCCQMLSDRERWEIGGIRDAAGF